jgi:hypothetical protein
MPPPDRDACLDKGQCRIIINDLEREISRLRRGLDGFERRCIEPPREVVRTEMTDRLPPPSPTAARSEARKPYAPDPLGKPLAIVEPPPAEPGVSGIENYLRITNLGTLIDVLA